jgi:hypothetical protein
VELTRDHSSTADLGAHSGLHVRSISVDDADTTAS